MRSPAARAALCLLLQLSCAHAGAQPPKPPPKPPADKARPRAPECQRDADCAAVPADCCGCSAGGAQQAGPREQGRKAARAQAAKCKDTACPAVMSNHPSCLQVPRCQAGRCELGAPAEEPPARPGKRGAPPDR